MKMGAGLFWGILLVLLGISLIFKVVFNVDFPVFKILFAFFFIFIGIKILVGGSGFFHFERGKNDVIFNEGFFQHVEDNDTEYSVVFGKGNFDFRDIDLSNGKSKFINVNTVFGGSEIILDKNIPVKIKVEAAFAGAELPNGNSTIFGTTYFESENFDASQPHLYIQADVVFGGLEIRYK